MDLNDWMTRRNLTDQEVADRVGLSRGYFNRVRNGLVHLSLEAALKIHDFVGGDVDMEELLPVRRQPYRRVRAWAPPTPPPAPVPSSPGKPRKPAAQTA